MQRLSVKLGRLRKKPSQDKIAAAKTGADGVEAFKEVACSGWLLKTGGKGHTIRNTKKRFFVLRGVFLSYYTEDPIKSSRKDREILKGQLYLVDCVVSEVINNNSNAPSSSASDSPRSDNNGGGKEYLLYAAKESTTSLDEWQKQVAKAAQRATTKFASDAFEGAWLYKKKRNTSWKKRWFLLRGNILSYFSEPPKSEDGIEALKGSFDISDCSEIKTELDPEDEPQVGKFKTCFKMKIDNTVYYIASVEEPVRTEWYNLIKRQMAKIATQYQMAQRGIGFMKQFRKSMSVDMSEKRTSLLPNGNGRNASARNSLILSAPPGSRTSTAIATTTAPSNSAHQQQQMLMVDPTTGTVTDDLMLSPMVMELTKVFSALDAMGINDEDIWDGKEAIYPVLRHFSQEIFAAATLFPINIVSFFFPEMPEFHGVTRKGYKVDKRMPVQRIIATILRALKVDTPPQQFALVTLSDYILNDNAPLVIYGLGSLLQNWQLKLVRKSKKQLKSAQQQQQQPPPLHPQPQQQQQQPGTVECPILVVFPYSKFPVQAQRAALNVDTPISTVIQKLCESHSVRHPDRYVLQTLEGFPLQTGLTLKSYGLGPRFKKWELRLVSRKDVASLDDDALPSGVRYAWVAVDEGLSIWEAKDIIRKLDVALAKTTLSAKSTITQLKGEVQRYAALNDRLAGKVRRLQGSNSSDSTLQPVLLSPRGGGGSDGGGTPPSAPPPSKRTKERAPTIPPRPALLASDNENNANGSTDRSAASPSPSSSPSPSPSPAITLSLPDGVSVGTPKPPVVPEKRVKASPRPAPAVPTTNKSGSPRIAITAPSITVKEEVSRGITAENNSSESEASATSISTATAASSLPSSSATTPREHSNLAPQSSPRSSRDNHDHDHDHDHDQAGQQQPEAFDSTLPVEPSDDPALGPNPDNDNANGTSADEGGSALASREHQAHEKNEDVKEVEGDNDENCVEEDHEVTTSIVAVSTGDNDDTSDGAHQQQQLQPDTAGEVDSGPATSATKQNLNILDVTEDDHDEPNQDNEEDKEEEVGDEGEDDIEDEDEDDIEDEVEDEDEDLLSASNSIASMTLLADTALTEIGVVEGEEPLTTTTHSPLPTTLEQAIEINKRFEREMEELRRRISEMEEQLRQSKHHHHHHVGEHSESDESTGEDKDEYENEKEDENEDSSISGSSSKHAKRLAESDTKPASAPTPPPPPPPPPPPAPTTTEGDGAIMATLGKDLKGGSKSKKKEEEEEKRKEKERERKEKEAMRKEAKKAEDARNNLLDSINKKQFSLKKVEVQQKKKKGQNDDLRDALEKRFAAMNMDEVEELDAWDDNDSSSANYSAWKDDSAWNDDSVLRI